MVLKKDALVNCVRVFGTLVFGCVLVEPCVGCSLHVGEMITAVP